MSFIERDLEKLIKERLFKKKVIILYGARQVGKTTLVKKMLAEYPGKGKYFNGEGFSVQRNLEAIEPEKIKSFFGDVKIVVLDEAQKIPRIGMVLKVMLDEYPELQIIATGSSSFELADKVSEPLTGRNFTFTLYPLALSEISRGQGISAIESKMENILRFGSYPEVFSLPEEAARERLDEIASDYLYKDVLIFEGMKKSEVIRNLLQLLALQLGQEVSFQELAQQLGINRLTVQKYIAILGKNSVEKSADMNSSGTRKRVFFRRRNL